MHDTALIAGAILMTAVFFLSLLPHTNAKTQTQVGPSCIISDNPAECLEIIKAKSLRRLGIERNRLCPRDSRARPNVRLIIAFNINNCFTTNEINICSQFKQRARGLLQIDYDSWCNIASAARTASAREAGFESLDLCSLVQLVSMKSVLGTLFGFDVNRTDLDRNIREFAREVNDRWLKSKAPPDEPWLYNHQHSLQHALANILPAHDPNNGIHNPLDFILPSYETLWRVVLCCIVEVVCRKGVDATKWKQALLRFMQDPTVANLNSNGGETNSVTALMVVEEALRLYPPTRRIYRDYVDSATDQSHRVAADIEACHRRTDVWGDDALLFHPERWLGDKSDHEFKSCNFFPFGAAPFECVAKTASSSSSLPFGVSMIAVLVGALITAFDDDCWEKSGNFPQGREPMCTDRTAYDCLILARKQTKGGDYTTRFRPQVVS